MAQRTLSLLFLFVFIFLTHSCVSISFSLKNVKSPHYYTRPPDSPWTLVDPGQADRAYRNPNGQAVLSINSVCHQYQTLSLDELTKNLTFGIEHPLTLKKSSHVVDGFPAQETLFEGSMDGSPFHMGLAVIRTRDCVYDVTLIARPEYFSQHEADFRRFYLSFKESGAPPP